MQTAIMDGLIDLPYDEMVKLEKILKESPDISEILESLLIRKYQAVKAGDAKALNQIAQEEKRMFGVTTQMLFVSGDS